MDDALEVGPGTRLGDRYRLLRLVGEGGMGRVFLAEDEQRGDNVAVKVLADDRPIPKAAQRFEREARSIARIEHENVVRVYDVGHSPRGGIYYVMEYLEGEELAKTVGREGSLPWARARHIALQICGALQAAHEQGIVHRDLKLENCFLVERNGDPEFVKILDFGVVKLLAPEHDDGERLTNTGATLGTPAYMAPELCRGKQVDHRVDVYALGVMIYEMITGGVPFEGDSFLDVALKHMNDPPPPLADHVPPALLPAGLDAVIVRALAKAREDRFPTMAAFARALRGVGEPGAGVVPTAIMGGTVPALPAVSDDPWTSSGGTVVTVPHGLITGPHPHTPPETRSLAWLWALGSFVVLTSLVGLGAWWSSKAPAPATALASASVERSESPPKVVPEAPPEAPLVEDRAPLELEASGDAEATSAAEPAFEGSTTGSEASPEAGREPTVSHGLSGGQIDAALRHVQPRVSACAGSLTGGKSGDRVRVTLRVDRGTGKVSSVDASTSGRNSGVEACVMEAVRKAQFARAGRGTQKIVRTLRL